MGALLKTAVGTLGRSSAALLLGTSLVILAASPAVAQSTVDMSIRLQRLERDIRDLQAATFKKPQGPLVDAPAQPAPAAAPEPPKVDLEPVMRRIDELA